MGAKALPLLGAAPDPEPVSDATGGNLVDAEPDRAQCGITSKPVFRSTVYRGLSTGKWTTFGGITLRSAARRDTPVSSPDRITNVSPWLGWTRACTRGS